MNRRSGHKIFLAIISLVLLISVVTPAFAAEQKTQVLQPQNIGSVTLRENVRAELNNLVMIPSDKGQSVGVTLTVHNDSNSEVDFIDYWLNIYSKSGTKYSVSVADKEVSDIPAKSSLDINFVTQVGANVKYSDLIFKVIRWDFSYSDFTRVLGQVSVNERYNIITPSKLGRVINTGESRLIITVDQANLGKSEKFYRPDIQITIKNEGKRTITLPEYELSILTKTGLLYPLTASNLKGTTLSPLSEKEFKLTASIPIEVNEDNWKLAVIVPLNEGKIRYPVALFDLPKTTVEDAEEFGKYYTFSNSDGVYNIKINSLNRLPISDNDLIVANLTIANNSDETIPIPNLKGEFKFNDSINKKATVSGNNKIIAIAPKTTINIQAVTVVPYTFDITKLNLIVQQGETGEAETELTDLVEFTQSGIFSPVPKIKPNEGYKIEDVGFRAEVKTRNIFTFAGTSANVIAAQITVQNNEKRVSDIQKLAGYYEHTDGSIYPATFQSITDKLSPGGTALLYAWTTVPKSINVKDMNLVLGKAVEEQSGEQSVLVGYVNPYSLTLPVEVVAKNDLQEIDIHPYKLSIDRIATQLRFADDQVKLEVDYTLEEDLLVSTNTKDQKVIIELEDSGNKAVFSQSYKLADTLEETGPSVLEIGKKQLDITWTDERLVSYIQTLKNFKFNIYLEIQPGYKKLIATQEIPWLVNRVINN